MCHLSSLNSPSSFLSSNGSLHSRNCFFHMSRSLATCISTAVNCVPAHHERLQHRGNFGSTIVSYYVVRHIFEQFSPRYFPRARCYTGVCLHVATRFPFESSSATRSNVNPAEITFSRARANRLRRRPRRRLSISQGETRVSG